MLLKISENSTQFKAIESYPSIFEAVIHAIEVFTLEIAKKKKLLGNMHHFGQSGGT